ncbi:glycosyltransferase family 2 protein [soil metagenome]
MAIAIAPGATESTANLPQGSSGSATSKTSESTPAALDAQSTQEIQPVDGQVSVVIPVLNEEGNIGELYRLVADSLRALDRDTEIIFVDDGSSDGTWEHIVALGHTDSSVIGLRHRRNFGKAQALASGFATVNGNLVITMDGDLQDDPAEIPRMIAAIDEGYDLVSGWKQDRQDPFGKTAPSRLFNWTVRMVTRVPLHDFNCGFKAYRREVTDNIRLYGELHRFTPVLAAAEGFRITELPVRHHPRQWGSSKYGMQRLVKGFLDLITVVFLTNYRQRPMHLFGLPGILALGVGILIGLKLTYDRLVLDQQIGTRPLLMLAVLLVVVGTQFFALGLLGEFLANNRNQSPPDPHKYLRTSFGVERLSSTTTGRG